MLNVITGATGHIGIALINELIGRGERIRAVCMKGEDVSHIKTLVDEISYADVRNYQEIKDAFKGADRVFHLAGVIAIGKEDQDIIFDVNVNGTKNCLRAAKEEKVKTFVYTSSVHAIYPKKGVLKEESRYDEKILYGNYSKTKAMGANAVMEENCEGFKTVVVMPSGVVGPYAYRRSNIGQLILEVKKSRLSVKIKGQYAYVDVRDVAFALAELADKGVGGESYIVSGETVSIKDMLDVISDKLHKKRINVFFPMWIAKASAWICELYYKARKMKPLFTSVSLYTLTSNCNFDTSKVKNAIGIEFRPVKSAIEDEIEFYEKEKIT